MITRNIKTKYHEVQFTEWGCQTYLLHGSTACDAIPHPNDPHYAVIAARCGYLDNIMAYCQEHELAHVVVAEFFEDRPSYVISKLIHQENPDKPDKPDNMYLIVCEELMAQTLQRYVRANEEPIIGGVAWDELKALFLHYLGKGT